MMKLLKQIFHNNKKIIENFSYLSLMQMVILLFPFMTYPYLLRVLGFNIYGTIIFAQTIAINIAIIINFGFNISGTKDIACNRENLSELSKIVSSIFSIKMILWLGCLIIYFILIYFVPFLRKDWLLYVISFFLTFNELLFPSWFFQGIEKMKYITFINIGVRLLFVIAIFVFVKDKTDFLIVPILNALGALLSGLIALYVVFVKEKIRFIRQPYLTLRYFFIDSFPLFISSLSVQVYVNINKILVGAFLGMTDVAIYDLGEKITHIIKIPIRMISQATFPKISREKNIAFVNKVMFITVSLISFLYMFLYFNSERIVLLLSGEENIQAVQILRILSFSAIISCFNLFLGGNRLVPFGYKKLYVKNAILNVLFFISGFIFLWVFSLINIYSLSYLYLMSEIFVFALNFYKCHTINLLLPIRK